MSELDELDRSATTAHKQISLIRLQKCVNLESSVMHKMYGFLETSERPFFRNLDFGRLAYFLQLKFVANCVFASYL